MMKKLFVKLAQSLFLFQPFESLLRKMVMGKNVNSFPAKFTPPNHTYKKTSKRLVKRGELRLFAHLYDYNDWKAYWGLREIERDRLYKLAASSSTVVDVGVNNGWVLMNMAQIVKGNNGFVYGFEPHPDTFNRCMQNVEASRISNCKVFNMGCSNERGEMVMVSEKETNSGQNRIVDAKESGGNATAVTVQVTTLDEQLFSEATIDLIKIDVEGFEFHVIKGARSIIERDKPLLFIEIDDRLLKKNGNSAAELLNYLLLQHQYNLYHATTGKPLTDIHKLTNCHIDVICSASSLSV